MKYTVITGASSGIGYEVAISFARRGENLILVARREDQLEKLKSEIKKINKNVDVIVRSIDLSITKNVYDLYESLKNYDLKTLINNAGFGDASSVKDQNFEKIERMIHLNVESLTILSSLYVKDYEQSEGSQLINVSSRVGYTLNKQAVTYSATKFYVSAFTEALSHQLKAKKAKLQAKVLAPGATETEFAQTSLDITDFKYEGSINKYHTAKEMAEFMLHLYDSNKTVGLVDSNFNFHLKDTVLPFTE